MTQSEHDPELLSVVVPVYNRARYLAAALESIVAQPFRPLQIVVVDDGSRDESAAIARRFPHVDLIALEHRGVAAARNTGVQAARGGYIAFLDSDDIWPPSKIEMQIRYLQEHPGVQCVLGRHENFLEDGIERPGWLREAPDGVASTIMVSMLARTAVFQRVGPFDETLEIGEDTDWMARAQDAGITMAILPDVIYRRRVHDSNLMSRHNHTAPLLRLLRASVQRKRGGG